MAPTSLYLNLPVANLPASTAFFTTALAGTLIPQFSNSTTSCVSLTPTLSLMLQSHSTFRGFTPKDKVIGDSHAANSAIYALGVEKREDVDELLEKVKNFEWKEDVGKAGGEEVKGGRVDVSELPQMEGMYGRSFEDLDGRVWEAVWMDSKFVEGQGQ